MVLQLKQKVNSLESIHYFRDTVSHSWFVTKLTDIDLPENTIVESTSLAKSMFYPSLIDLLVLHLKISRLLLKPEKLTESFW